MSEASLLPSSGVLLEVSAQAPAPSKDFHQFIISSRNTIWRTWNITLRNDYRRLNPTESKQPIEDFAYDERLQFDVRRVFGLNTLEYAKNLCMGKIDYFARLPMPLLIYLVSFLELEDVAALAQTSKQFYEVCNNDSLWERIYEIHCDTMTDEMKSLAEQIGWKKMFFTNKLQLQVQLRRHQQRINSPDGDKHDSDTFITD
ncbi:F-box only protein 36-like [Anneissia japonica]|uniref:F-box only protein 36-like n=1 Tax=Anneissia japonica TaxID=1529436 RepID=UPI0014255F08|nr:F-box only protein 36-like [Anneissia japonica]